MMKILPLALSFLVACGPIYYPTETLVIPTPNGVDASLPDSIPDMRDASVTPIDAGITRLQSDAGGTGEPCYSSRECLNGYECDTILHRCAPIWACYCRVCERSSDCGCSNAYCVGGFCEPTSNATCGQR